ncbi:MAG TPA: hypothetical protein VN914_04025, partial [Polyangia bacterium]|nr:hypothetical protein [Polyangia bacterium]
MTNFRIIGPTIALVASVLACASPDYYTPKDSGADQVLEESPDTAAPSDKGDSSGSPTDAPVLPDGGGTPPSTDTSAPSPDGPCGTPTDPRNCGTCGHDCAQLAHVVGSAVTCQAGKCVVPPSACVVGYAHCSANVDDGCETSLANQQTCGGCTTKCMPNELCAVSGATFQCVGGCMGATPDKCATTCTDLKSDIHNCGACAHDCAKLPNVRSGAPLSCQSGACVVPAGSCSTGFADCNGKPDDGCEVDLSRADTCGGCNTKCDPGKACTPSGQTFQCTCGSGSPDTCSGGCTNLQTDSHNCGSCGHDCATLANVKAGASVSCQGGHCVIPASSCVSGFGHCGPSPPDNGCETNISVPQTCGCSS